MALSRFRPILDVTQGNCAWQGGPIAVVTQLWKLILRGDYFESLLKYKYRRRCLANELVT